MTIETVWRCTFGRIEARDGDRSEWAPGAPDEIDGVAEALALQEAFIVVILCKASTGDSGTVSATFSVSIAAGSSGEHAVRPCSTKP